MICLASLPQFPQAGRWEGKNTLIIWKVFRELNLRPQCTVIQSHTSCNVGNYIIFKLVYNTIVVSVLTVILLSFVLLNRIGKYHQLLRIDIVQDYRVFGGVNWDAVPNIFTSFDDNDNKL